MTLFINPESLFVSPQELETLRSSSEILILDASWHMPATGKDAYEDYLNEHIPGAVFFDIDAISDKKTDLPHMLPSALGNICGRSVFLSEIASMSKKTAPGMCSFK